MKKSLRGALAATAGGVLLLGGAGSLAYWTDAKDVGTEQIASGSITLSDPDCTGAAGAHDWQLDGKTAFTDQKLVPGDVLERVCDMTLTLVGDHVGATLAIDTPSLSADASSSLDDELDPEATFTLDDAAYTGPITAPGTHTVRATLTVTFDGASATNDSQNGSLSLNAINVTATQTHDPTP